MKTVRAWYLGAAVFGVAGVLAAGPLTAQVTVTIDAATSAAWSPDQAARRPASG